MPIILTTSLPYYPPYESVVLADNPTVYARLSETVGATVVDEQGNFDGTYVGSYVRNEPSIFNNNQGGSVLLGGSGWLDFGTSVDKPELASYSVEIWMQRTITSVSPEMVFSYGNYASQLEGVSIFIEAGAIFFRLNGAGGTTERRGIAAAGTGGDTNSHHLVLVIDRVANELKGYVDGVEYTTDYAGYGTTLVGVSAISPTESMYLGRGSTAGVEFNGRIEDFALYPGIALTPAQIAYHHAAGRFQP